jgi:hypothetical protein
MIVKSFEALSFIFYADKNTHQRFAAMPQTIRYFIKGELRFFQ